MITTSPVEVFTAALGDDMAVLEDLLHVPENVNLCNDAGETVLDVVNRSKKDKAAELIKSYGGMTHIELTEQLGGEVSMPRSRAELRKASSPMTPTAPQILYKPSDYAELRTHLDQEVASLHAQIKTLTNNFKRRMDDIATLGREGLTDANMDREVSISARKIDLTVSTRSEESMGANQCEKTPATPDTTKSLTSPSAPTPRDRAAYEEYTKQNWRKIRDLLMPDISEDATMRIKTSFRLKIVELDQNLSIFQVLWLLNTPLWPCSTTPPTWPILRHIVRLHPTVTFSNWLELMIQVLLVSLVQLVIPFLLVFVMVLDNHVDDDADDEDTALSFCPAQDTGRHHPVENEFTCAILMLYLIGNVLTSAPRSRLLCLQFATAKNTAGDSMAGRYWLVVGFLVTTLMQIMCTAATYVLFIEYEDMADLLLNAVALVFVLEADTMIARIYEASHLVQSGQVHEDKHHWLEHARGTKKWARFGLLAGQPLSVELGQMLKGQIGKTHSVYLIFYTLNLLWQIGIFFLMPICY